MGVLAKIVVVAALMGAATPVLAAGEWVHCADTGGLASFDYLADEGAGLSVAALTVTAGERVWASDVANGPGDPVQAGQAFENAETIRIDAVDESRAQMIAELRLFKASDVDGTLVRGGTLRIAGMGIWAVTCGGQ